MAAVRDLGTETVDEFDFLTATSVLDVRTAAVDLGRDAWTNVENTT